jgi:hypothetical protein
MYNRLEAIRSLLMVIHHLAKHPEQNAHGSAADNRLVLDALAITHKEATASPMLSDQSSLQFSIADLGVWRLYIQCNYMVHISSSMGLILITCIC